jgi:ribosomal protein S18 acetylase RimI-like enzyme
MSTISKIYYQTFLIESISLEKGIRKAKDSDGDDLVNIDSKSYKHPFNDSSDYTSNDFRTFVHDDKSANHPQGYVQIIPSERSRKFDYIYSIATHPDHRGKNISDKLIQAVINRGHDVHLHVRTSNEKAINLYKKHGFEVYHTIKKHYGDGESAHYMIRPASK